MQFQYRKRYGLHAIPEYHMQLLSRLCFNTASGMDCMQSQENPVYQEDDV